MIYGCPLEIQHSSAVHINIIFYLIGIKTLKKQNIRTLLDPSCMFYYKLILSVVVDGNGGSSFIFPSIILSFQLGFIFSFKYTYDKCSNNCSLSIFACIIVYVTMSFQLKITTILINLNNSLLYG
jgi:hypothetical protein